MTAGLGHSFLAPYGFTRKRLLGAFHSTRGGKNLNICVCTEHIYVVCIYVMCMCNIYIYTCVHTHTHRGQEYIQESLNNPILWMQSDTLRHKMPVYLFIITKYSHEIKHGAR